MRPGRREICQTGLEKNENWARQIKMHFNEKKSEVLLVTTKISGENRTLNIYLNNKRLEQVSKCKYLGIYFDSRFRFDRHVDYITGKCTPIINMLAKSANYPNAVWGIEHWKLSTVVQLNTHHTPHTHIHTANTCTSPTHTHTHTHHTHLPTIHTKPHKHHTPCPVTMAVN